MTSRDSVQIDESIWWSGAWHLLDVQRTDTNRRVVGECGGDGFSDSSGGIVVFCGDDATSDTKSMLGDGLSVQRLDGERINDGGVDSWKI